jgi:hypothetical protein
MSMTTPTDLTHLDLVVLTAFLADNGWSGKSIADVVEKPWHYLEELKLAQAVGEHEASAGGDHRCAPQHDAERWYCYGQQCDWEHQLPEGIEI